MRHSDLTRSRLAVATIALAFLVVGLGGSPCGWAARTHRAQHHTTARRHTSRHATLHRTARHHTRHHRASRRLHAASRGQQVMDSQRATEIQQALIQAHYLDGTPTGHWDSEAEAAMQKYQADNGWQSKIAPDSRALIKLGLGPKQDAGEYSSNPTGVSALTETPPVDTIRTMAISEMPGLTRN